MTLLFLLPIAIVAIIESYSDAKKENPEHALSAFFRIVGVAAYTFFVVDSSVYDNILFFLSGLVVYWIPFDPFYNLFKGNVLWYIGNTSKIDKFVRKHITKDLLGFTMLKGLLLAFLMIEFKYNFILNLNK